MLTFLNVCNVSHGLMKDLQGAFRKETKFAIWQLLRVQFFLGFFSIPADLQRWGFSLVREDEVPTVLFPEHLPLHLWGLTLLAHLLLL